MHLTSFPLIFVLSKGIVMFAGMTTFAACFSTVKWSPRQSTISVMFRSIGILVTAGCFKLSLWRYQHVTSCLHTSNTNKTFLCIFGSRQNGYGLSGKLNGTDSSSGGCLKNLHKKYFTLLSLTEFLNKKTFYGTASYHWLKQAATTSPFDQTQIAAF